MRNCNACTKHIKIVELLDCTICKKQYHHFCVNITKEYYKTHLNDLQRNWACPGCRNSTRRINNDDTPIRSLIKIPQQILDLDETYTVLSKKYSKTHKTGSEKNYFTLKCEGCPNKINDSLYMICCLCKGNYDLTCANLSNTQFRRMEIEKKKLWRCVSCISNKSPISNDPNTQGILVSYTPILQKENHPNYNNSDSSIDSTLLGNTLLTEDKNDTKTELTLLSLSKLISLKLKENNKSIISQLQSTIQSEINKAITKIKEEIEQDTNILYIENEQRKNEIEDVNKQIDKLSKETEKLKREVEHLKNQTTSKTKNYPAEYNQKKFVLYGMEEYRNEPESNLYGRIIGIFRDYMRIDLSGYIEETIWIGRSQKRPLTIELISKRMVKYIQNNKHHLRGTGLYVSEYLDENARKDRKAKQISMINARKHGKHAIIRNNNLYIEGQLISFDEDSNKKAQKYQENQRKEVNKQTKENEMHTEVFTKTCIDQEPILPTQPFRERKGNLGSRNYSI